MTKANMPKLAKKAENDRLKEVVHKQKMINSVEHTGDTKKAIERVLLS